MNSKSSLLKEYFDKNRISNVRSIINIILQLVIYHHHKNTINFQFNDCNLNNIFCFNIESSSSLTKYLKYKLSNFGDIVVRCKYFFNSFTFTIFYYRFSFF